MATSFVRTGLVALVVTLFCMAGSASAATFDVNSTKDEIDADTTDGVCASEDGERTLRACIMQANASEGEDTVNVPEGWYKLTLEPEDSESDEQVDDLDITDPDGLTIDGTGDARFTVIDANGLDRGVELGSEEEPPSKEPSIEGRNPIGNASILDMTIRNGFLTDEDFGGGIKVGFGGDLTLTRSLVIHNAAVCCGGGGIFAEESSTLTLDSTTVERNTAGYFSYGGGIYSQAEETTVSGSTVNSNTAWSGGGIFTSSSGGTTISDSSIEENRAEYTSFFFGEGGFGGFGGYGGGIYVAGSPTTIERSSVNHNSSDADGGGIYNEYYDNCQQCTGLLGDELVPVTSVENTTLSGNIAAQGFETSGDGGAIYNNGDMSILNATIADGQTNDYDSGGAIYANGTTQVKNTILATSTRNGEYDPCAGEGIESLGNNLQTENDLGCGFDSTPDDGDKSNADPRLARLADNGGPTRTRALLDGSAAIDAASNDGCPATDQRGVGRPPANGNAGPNCDIGAYEVSSTPAPQQQQPASTPQQQQQCTPAAPRSSISRNSLQIEDNTVKLTGRSTDQLCEGQLERGAIRRVRLAIGLDLGSECRFLRRNGNLGARRDCDNRQFINARLGEVRNGKVPWTFRLRGLDLTNGVYDLVALGVDAEGNRETRLRKFNHKRFRLR